MENTSGDTSDSALASRIDGNELSFTSVPFYNETLTKTTRKTDRSLQGSASNKDNNSDIRPFDNSGRTIPELQYNDDEEDDEGDLDYDSSGLAIPRLRDSMTPWRGLDKVRKPNTKNPSSRSATLLDVSSSTNSRPTTRNSLFSVEGAYSVASSTEVEYLQKQLTTYKLKVRSLLELIKQLNCGDYEQKSRDSFYGKLLSTISQNDELEELKRHVVDLENDTQAKQKKILHLEQELSILSEQLNETKNEHAQTLEYANEYLEHSELLAKHIDEMLTMLLEKLDVSFEEREALQKARQISSSFVMVKMNALLSTFRRVLDDIGSNSTSEQIQDHPSNVSAIANSTGIDVMTANDTATKKDDAIDEFAIDTRLEMVIEDLHEEYDKFVQGIRKKVEKSAELEKLLMNKLSKQNKLLHLISEIDEAKAEVEQSEDHDQSSILSNIGEFSRRASLDLSKSHQNHIDSLNTLIRQLRNNLADKNEELQQLKEQLQDLDRLRRSKDRWKHELDDLKELAKVKESNWEDFTNDLEETVQLLQVDKARLLEVVDQLNSELDVKREENERVVQNLKKVINTARLQSKGRGEENDRLHQELQNKTKEIDELRTEHDLLHNLLSEVKNDTSATQRYEADFQTFKKHLLLYLGNVFQTLGKILQQKSIDQSRRKLEVIGQMEGLAKVKIIQTKLESLYNFIETALESIVESYMGMIVAERDKTRPETSNEKDMQLRIEELERKWISERERRKLDSNAAETRIDKLESENELLREQLYNMTIRK